MNLSRTCVDKVLSSQCTVKQLLKPFLVLQSSLYSTSSSTGKPGYIKKPVQCEEELSSELNDQQNLGFPSEPIVPQQNISFNKDLPRPSEIPWQTKIVNSVNLIGSVSTPVQFQKSPEGKYFAGTVLTQEHIQDSAPLWIPIIFEGELAHIAACHLKEKDLVHVAGQLSGEHISTQHGQSSIQVMVHSMDFVQESQQVKERFTPYKKDEQVVSLSGLANKSLDSFWRDLINHPDKWWDYRTKKLNQTLHPKYPDFKHKDSGQALWLNSAPKWALPGLQILNNKGLGSDEESWKDLVENPNKWWDNRSDKFNEKSPDFKHKDTGKKLWLDSSPTWVLAKLPPLKPNVAAVGKRDTLLS